MNWQGELLHIHIAPQASAPMQALSEARLIVGIGIEGDRYASRLGTYSQRHHVDRQATLIEVETLEALARDRNITLGPHEHRRNLTTRGVPLNHLVGQCRGLCALWRAAKRALRPPRGRGRQEGDEAAAQPFRSQL
jgi:MOSC domain-containing protein YiiM